MRNALEQWKARAEKAEAELEMFRESLTMAEAELVALKKDVCEVSEWCFINGPEYIRETARRILEATKEEP